MTWSLEFAPPARKGPADLDPAVARRILKFLNERIAPLDEPRTLGGALRGSALGFFWRFRVGAYRLICFLKDDRFLVLVVRLGHRREVYR